MNAKKANWAFLISILVLFAVQSVAVRLFPVVLTNLFLNNLLMELTMLLPFLVILLLSRKECFAGESRSAFLGFHKLRVSSILMIVLFTLFSTPAITLINLISQLWVKNEALEVAQSYQLSLIHI